MNAFPREYRTGGHNGMTLRDYFAGQALTGLLAGRQPNNAYPLEYLAETSYATADAMIEARDK
jgi:hypothetical protein